MYRAKIHLLVIGCLLFVTACGGWHLRGTNRDAVSLKSVSLDVGSAPRMARAIRKHLAYAGVKVRSRSEAQAVIEISGEDFDRRVLSVDPDTGKVREVEVALQVRYSVRGRDGKFLAKPQKLTWEQDFIFDESSLLGTIERESIIERELAEDAAQAIILRLETIDAPTS